MTIRKVPVVGVAEAGVWAPAPVGVRRLYAKGGRDFFSYHASPADSMEKLVTEAAFHPNLRGIEVRLSDGSLVTLRRKAR